MVKSRSRQGVEKKPGSLVGTGFPGPARTGKPAPIGTSSIQRHNCCGGSANCRRSSAPSERATIIDLPFRDTFFQACGGREWSRGCGVHRISRLRFARRQGQTRNEAQTRSVAGRDTIRMPRVEGCAP